MAKFQISSLWKLISSTQKQYLKPSENAEHVKTQGIERRAASHAPSYPVKEGSPQSLWPSNKMTNGGRNCGSSNILSYSLLNISSMKTFK